MNSTFPIINILSALLLHGSNTCFIISFGKACHCRRLPPGRSSFKGVIAGVPAKEKI
jgi:hypothetical protein